MNTIQTQVVLVHLDSGLTAASSLQRAAIESSFSADSITVTTAESTVSTTGLTVPRQVALKLISGHDVKVGFSSGSYPLSLHGVNDCMLLNLESREDSTIVCEADYSESLSGAYLDLHDFSGPVRFWFNITDAVTASVAPSTPAGGRLVTVDIIIDTTAIDVAVALSNAINSDGKWISVAPSKAITVTNIEPGILTNADNGTTGWVITSGGSTPSTIYLKSLGTSQIVVAVAPI